MYVENVVENSNIELNFSALIFMNVTLSFQVARGKVLVYLDSHCEVQESWLQPLLARIKKNRKTVASPVIDNINLFDFSNEPVSTYLRGGFDWRLDFFWEWLPAADRARQKCYRLWKIVIGIKYLLPQG